MRGILPFAVALIAATPLLADEAAEARALAFVKARGADYLRMSPGTFHEDVARMGRLSSSLEAHEGMMRAFGQAGLLDLVTASGLDVRLVPERVLGSIGDADVTHVKAEGHMLYGHDGVAERVPVSVTFDIAETTPADQRFRGVRIMAR